jgi:hypothetical protein
MSATSLGRWDVCDVCDEEILVGDAIGSGETVEKRENAGSAVRPVA